MFVISLSLSFCLSSLLPLPPSSLLSLIFKKVWEFSGGHAGTIYKLHERLRNGLSLNEAMSAILHRVGGERREERGRSREGG
jgi:hypothetical protein